MLPYEVVMRSVDGSGLLKPLSTLSCHSNERRQVLLRRHELEHSGLIFKQHKKKMLQQDNSLTDVHWEKQRKKKNAFMTKTAAHSII